MVVWFDSYLLACTPCHIHRMPDTEGMGGPQLSRSSHRDLAASAAVCFSVFPLGLEKIHKKFSRLNFPLAPDLGLL